MLHSKAEAVQNDCRLETENAINSVISECKKLASTEQKTVNRCVEPFIKERLIATYKKATAEKGKGCVQRQKTIMHDFLAENGPDILGDCSQELIANVQAIKRNCEEKFRLKVQGLASKIEVVASRLWDEPVAEKMEQSMLLLATCSLNNYLDSLAELREPKWGSLVAVKMEH